MKNKYKSNKAVKVKEKSNISEKAMSLNKLDENNIRKIVPVNYDKYTQPRVNGRELHCALQIKTPYHKWFPRMCAYGFYEGQSYWAMSVNGDGFGKAISRTEHSLTICMAKELCMLQRSEAGRILREYFMLCEEVWNSPDKIIERALLFAKQKAIKAEQQILELVQENQSLETAIDQSIKYYTVQKYNKTYRKGWDSKACIEINKNIFIYCRLRSIEIKKCETNDERFESVYSYPLTAWDSFLGNMA